MLGRIHTKAEMFLAYDDIGGDNHDDSHNNKTGQEESTGKGPESDTSDTSDSDKKCNGEETVKLCLLPLCFRVKRSEQVAHTYVGLPISNIINEAF
ncbi:MAG: hypothetical protein WA364_01765 [Candidatus Nitrosopolaris sp.]